MVGPCYSRPSNRFCSVGYFLGFGGNKTQLLLKAAKDDMINNRPLAHNETYKNVNLDVSRNFYVIFSKLTYTLTADVVQTGEIAFNAPILPDTNLFHYGDSIFNNNGNFKGYFIHERVNEMVQYRTEKGKIKDASKNLVYSKKSTFNDLTLGKEVKFKTEFYSEGKIVAFGYYKLVVLTYDNQHLELDYHLVSP